MLDGSKGGVCVLCIYQQRWEVIDVGFVLALQSKLESWATFSGPLSSLSTLFFWFQCRLYTQLTHTHTHFSALLCLTRKRVIFQHLCSSVPLCLFPEAAGTPGPELPLLLSSLLCSFFSPLPCLAVMSHISFQVCSHD